MRRQFGHVVLELVFELDAMFVEVDIHHDNSVEGALNLASKFLMVGHGVVGGDGDATAGVPPGAVCRDGREGVVVPEDAEVLVLLVGLLKHAGVHLIDLSLLV